MTASPQVPAATAPDRAATVTRTVLAVVGVLAVVVFALSSPFFLSVDNLVNLLDDIAVTGILAVPVTFLVMSGHVDLSVGAVAAFTGIVVGATAPEVGLPVAVLLGVATGAVVGLVNGLVVTVGGVDSLATTFAAMALLRGLAYWVPSGLAVAVSGFRALGGAGPVLGLSVPTLVFAGLAVLGGALSVTAVGRDARAVGALPAATRLDAPRERRWVLGLFVVTGLAAALDGLVRTSQLGTGLPTSATGVEVVVLAAVLFGGGRLGGGRGSVGGTVLAVAVVAVIDNGLSLANVTAYAAQVFHAALLVLALVLDRSRRRPRRSAARRAAARAAASGAGAGAGGADGSGAEAVGAGGAGAAVRAVAADGAADAAVDPAALDGRVDAEAGR
ncbi:ABC transporter permease [Nakamurella endophytica]|uniref:ABC transporter permease n=1 Tax=Nakamurella endophytica TaxID=1748367 RepID=A0A917WJI0_9ACTN|nr:ABC transporter permease [Nakamurella endophytica]GGM10600.1 hypothetical protein GCM10011594_33120 [Nakamurella endophytica]